MVNAGCPVRFESVGSDSTANRAAGLKRAKKSLPLSESGGIFNRYLSDLYSSIAKRIGALGQAPTFPDDSEAELQEVCVTARRVREGVEGLWRRL